MATRASRVSTDEVPSKGSNFQLVPSNAPGLTHVKMEIEEFELFENIMNGINCNESMAQVKILDGVFTTNIVRVGETLVAFLYGVNGGLQHIAVVSNLELTVVDTFDRDNILVQNTNDSVTGSVPFSISFGSTFSSNGQRPICNVQVGDCTPIGAPPYINDFRAF